MATITVTAKDTSSAMEDSGAHGGHGAEQWRA